MQREILVAIRGVLAQVLLVSEGCVGYTDNTAVEWECSEMPYSDDLWKKAKEKCRLNVEEIELAKKLGIDPKSLMKNIPSKSQPWKAPVGVWLREIDAKRQKKSEQKLRRRETTKAPKQTQSSTPEEKLESAENNG